MTTLIAEYHENTLIDAINISNALSKHPLMGPHPISYSDPRVQGFILEMKKTPENMDRLSKEIPELVKPLERFEDRESDLFLLAVNRYPPTSKNDFILKPHVDRHYHNSKFNLDLAPTSTVVVFLDFPDDASGGELVVFPTCSPDDFPDSIPRENARLTVKKYGGELFSPIPGSACILKGPVIHGVIGYEAPSDCRWRTVLVIAQFKLPPVMSTFSLYQYHRGR